MNKKEWQLYTISPLSVDNYLLGTKIRYIFQTCNYLYRKVWKIYKVAIFATSYFQIPLTDLTGSEGMV